MMCFACVSCGLCLACVCVRYNVRTLTRACAQPPAPVDFRRRLAQLVRAQCVAGDQCVCVATACHDAVCDVDLCTYCRRHCSTDSSDRFSTFRTTSHCRHARVMVWRVDVCLIVYCHAGTAHLATRGECVM
jgi:hypothetical protein